MVDSKLFRETDGHIDFVTANLDNLPTTNQKDSLAGVPGFPLSGADGERTATKDYVLSVAGGSGVQFKQEIIPVTALNTLDPMSTASSDPNSLILFVNGFAVENGIDFTVSGTTISWISPVYNINTTDIVTVFYKIAGAGSIMLETLPVTALNTISDVTHTPIDVLEVLLFVNGQLRLNGIDYTISGLAVTWNPVYFNVVTTDVVIVFYRY